MFNCLFPASTPIEPLHTIQPPKTHTFLIPAPTDTLQNKTILEKIVVGLNQKMPYLSMHFQHNQQPHTLKVLLNNFPDTAAHCLNDYHQFSDQLLSQYPNAKHFSWVGDGANESFINAFNKFNFVDNQKESTLLAIKNAAPEKHNCITHALEKNNIATTLKLLNQTIYSSISVQSSLTECFYLADLMNIITGKTPENNPIINPITPKLENTLYNLLSAWVIYSPMEKEYYPNDKSPALVIYNSLLDTENHSLITNTANVKNATNSNNQEISVVPEYAHKYSYKQEGQNKRFYIDMDERENEDEQENAETSENRTAQEKKSVESFRYQCCLHDSKLALHNILARYPEAAVTVMFCLPNEIIQLASVLSFLFTQLTKTENEKYKKITIPDLLKKIKVCILSPHFSKKKHHTLTLPDYQDYPIQCDILHTKDDAQFYRLVFWNIAPTFFQIIEVVTKKEEDNRTKDRMIPRKKETLYDFFMGFFKQKKYVPICSETTVLTPTIP